MTSQMASVVSQMASLQEEFRSFKADNSSCVDEIQSKVDDNHEESTNKIRTLAYSLANLRDFTALANSTAEMKLASDVVKVEHRQHTLPLPPSPHITDALAQTITNCTYPNAPLLSHHPIHVVPWFRQSILRKSKTSNPSNTFHYDSLRKFSPDVFLTLRDQIHFNDPKFRFPNQDDDFYSAILTTIFYEKSYDNLLLLINSVVPSTSDACSDHIFVCGIQSLVTILPQHLSQYDIKHVTSAIRKFLSP